MGENYTVNYQINVNASPALQAIRKFQEATLEMEKCVTRFDAVARSIGKVNAALASVSSKPINLQINTSQAEAGLKRVLGLLRQVDTQAKIAVSGRIKSTGGVKATTLMSGSSPLNTRAANSDLRTLMSTIEKTQMSIANLNKRRIHPKADTKIAQTNLDKLLATINAIKQNRTINIVTTSGNSVASTAKRMSGTSLPKPRPPQTTRNTGKIRGGLSPDVQRVLGPTYANSGTNVAGEMVKGIGITYGLSALMSGVSSVFKDAAEYNNITQTTRNILSTHDKSGGFDGRFDQMNKLMRQVGVETKFTAPQVAEAGKFLAMAGFNVDQIKQSIRPITDLALIGDTDLGETADVVTNIMTSYGIPAKHMNEAADVLTMTFTKTNTKLLELAESFKYAGTIAHQIGVPFGTASAALGLLGDAGIKGSHAGTTLRMMLLNMMNPTKRQRAAWQSIGVSPTDEQGNLRELPDILGDLHSKRQGMSAGHFATLISTMFRISADPGVLAFIANYGKLKEVIAQNDMSSGLASKLSLEKQNTITGLWYQMTSAFTESGMKGFEAMEGVIRQFLQRMITLMKSPEFAQALKGMMDMFLKIVNVIVDVFKKIMSLWNSMPQWGKDGLVWFVKIQMVLGIVAGIGKSILSTWVMFKNVLGGSWLSKILLGPLSSALTYMLRLYAIQKNIVGLSMGKALLKTVTGGLLHTWRGIKSWGRGEALANTVGAAGGAVGEGGGKAIGWLSKMGSASLVGASRLLLTTPIGWGVSAAAALTAIGIKIYRDYHLIEAARKATEAWGESFRKLGVDKLDLSDPDALMIGNMRIFNNELLTQNERVAESVQLWKRYWEEKNGYNAPSKGNEDDKLIDIDPDFKKTIDSLLAWGDTNKVTRDLEKSLSQHVNLDQVLPQDDASQPQGSTMSRTMNFIGTGGGRYGVLTPYISRKVQLALVEMAVKPDNPKLVAYEKAQKALLRAYNYDDYLQIKKSIDERLLPKEEDGDSKWDYAEVSQIKRMSPGDLDKSPTYIRALSGEMQKRSAWTDDVGDMMKDADAGKKINLDRVQQIAQKHVISGEVFDTSNGLFGTEEWTSHMKALMDNNKLGVSVEESVAHINEIFQSLIQFYNELSVNYKPLFKPLLNRDPWQNLLPKGYKLAEGSYEGGQKLGKTLDSADLSMSNAWTPKSKTDDSEDLDSDLGYSPRYENHSAAPKQVIVRIENLMRVDQQTIDMTDERQTAALDNIKQELATALLDVVQDFNANVI